MDQEAWLEEANHRMESSTYDNEPIDAFYERCGREQTTLMSTD
jgi:hypothetical protein